MGHPFRFAGFLRAILCASVALGTVGCYEIHEEVWIREDGTVRYALDYAVPEFMIITATQVDGGNADSALAQMRPPAAMVVEGDSVWNRDFLDRDLRHFVSERRFSSLERWIARATREEARQDSFAYAIAKRDSVSKVLTKGVIGKRYLEIMDSLRQAEPQHPQPSTNPLAEVTGSVLGGYRMTPDRSGAIGIRHIVFPKNTRARVMDADEGDDRPSLRMFSGRNYSYRLHAPRILSSGSPTSSGDRWVEWSFPMTDLSDSVRTLDAVISPANR